MESIIVIVHIVVAVAIVGLVLLQQGKGADAGASFGSGASQTVFGSSGSGNFLVRQLSVQQFFSSPASHCRLWQRTKLALEQPLACQLLIQSF